MAELKTLRWSLWEHVEEELWTNIMRTYHKCYLVAREELTVKTNVTIFIPLVCEEVQSSTLSQTDTGLYGK